MSKFIKAVESGLEGLTHVSVGIIDSCEDCPSGEDEGFFSWSSCDCCNSSLGGTRYAAHGVDVDGNIVHLDVCVDCEMYIANGDEPDQWHP